MSKPEIEIIEPNYEGLAKVIDSLKDLYQMNGITSSMIETCFKHLMQPPTILHNNPNGENLDIGPKPTNEITKKDIELLNWIYDRFYNVYKENKNIDFMHALLKLIQKLENNGK